MADKIRDLIASITSGLGELTAEVDRVLPPVPVSTNVVRVRPGDDLAAAIASLKEGGTVLGQPGEYFMNYEPIERASRAFVTVQTDTANLPKPGQRITRDYLPGLMVIRSKNKLDGSVTVKAKPVGGLAFMGVAFGPQAKDRTMLELGWDPGALKTPEQRPRDFLFDRTLFMGDPLVGQHRAIQANCLNLIVRGSGFYDIHEAGRDSQAICGWNGTENVLIENTYAAAGAENIMFGGAPSASKAMNPKRIKIIGSFLDKDRKWMDLPVVPSIKALFEIKNVEDFYMAGCILQNNWKKDWASGVAMTLKVAPGGNAPWTTMKDVLIEDIVIRFVGKPLDIVGWNDNNGSAAGSDRASNVVLRNWLIYETNRGVFLGDGRGISTYTLPHDLKVDHFTMAGPTYNDRNSFLTINQPDPIDGDLRASKARGLELTNSLLDHGSYAIHSSSAIGKAALDKFCEADYKVTGNAVKRGSGSRALPAGNPAIDAAAFDASFAPDGFTLLPGSTVASVATLDGSAPGADVSKIKARLADPL